MVKDEMRYKKEIKAAIYIKYSTNIKSVCLTCGAAFGEVIYICPVCGSTELITKQ